MNNKEIMTHVIHSTNITLINDFKAVLIAHRTSGKNVDILEGGTLNSKDSDLNESPVVRYCSAISSFSLAGNARLN